MLKSHTGDGRILTPPKKLEPKLKDSFPAFYKMIGHIRFFYVADEIWDGKASLVYKTCSEILAEVKICDGFFTVRIAKDDFRIADEIPLGNVYEALNKSAAPSQRRPQDQLIANLDEYPSGIRCDMCLGNKIHLEKGFVGNQHFEIMTRHCYDNEEGWNDEINDNKGGWCDGKQGCYEKTLPCLKEKGIRNCLECGEYHTCGNCGVGLEPSECNLGITAEEVTNLIIPYCEMERLDFMREETTA